MIRRVSKETKDQFVRYVIIGVVNTALDFGLYAFLTRSFDFWMEHYLLANAVAFTIVVTWSFFWNKYWTFRNRDVRHAHQYAKFVFATLTGILIAESILYMGVAQFGFHDILSKVLAAPFVVVWNFLAYRLWAFRASRKMVPEVASNQIDEYETP